MRINFLLFLITIIFIGCRESSEELKNIMYFNQQPPGDTAFVFAPGIISTINHEHSRITFSKDGLEMYWAVILVDTNYKTTGSSPFLLDEQNIWQSKLVNGKWTDPALFEFTKNSSGSSPAFSADGNAFFYRSLIPGVVPNITPKPSQLWKVTRADEHWGKPVKENNLIIIEEKKTFMSFCFADNGNLYFDYGTIDETGEWWWYVCFSEYKDGKYSEPVRMGNGINDGEASWCPWVSPDESYIIYSSHREGEFGRGDLYINFKGDDGTWSDPINMGSSVNSEMQERFPSVAPDGQYLFFARNMPDTYSDIFWVSTKIIDELRSKQ